MIHRTTFGQTSDEFPNIYRLKGRLKVKGKRLKGRYSIIAYFKISNYYLEAYT